MDYIIAVTTPIIVITMEICSVYMQFMFKKILLLKIFFARFILAYVFFMESDMG